MSWRFGVLKSKLLYAVLFATAIVSGGYLVVSAVQELLSEATIFVPQRVLKDTRPFAGNADESSVAWAQAQYKNLEKAVADVWGSQETVLPSPTRYVKYSQDYQARALVDFERGDLKVETVNSIYPVRSLKEAIVSTILAQEGDGAVQFSDADARPANQKDPALYGQILDDKGRPMRYGDRAVNYANELIKNSLQKRDIWANGSRKTVYSIKTRLQDDSLSQRTAKYKDIITNAARKYGLSDRLLLAITKTESYFNPFAVSRASAYGLMQIVPSSAGAEVYELLNGRKGRPQREHLFDAANNIEYGAAYLHILAKRYFGGIDNPSSLKLCTIAAYNGGPSAVLKTFGPTREQAIQKINSMDHNEVYRHLIKNLPSYETKRYVDKVVAAMSLFTADSQFTAAYQPRAGSL